MPVRRVYSWTDHFVQDEPGARLLLRIRSCGYIISRLKRHAKDVGRTDVEELN